MIFQCEISRSRNSYRSTPSMSTRRPVGAHVGGAEPYRLPQNANSPLNVPVPRQGSAMPAPSRAMEGSFARALPMSTLRGSHELPVKRERDVVGDLGARQLAEVGGIEHQQHGSAGGGVEHHRQQHAVVLALGLGPRDEHGLSRIG